AKCKMQNEKRDRRPVSSQLFRFSFCILHFALLAGCRQKMADQPAYHWPDQPSDFFPDGQGNRPVEPDTVARGQLDDDAWRYTGLTGPGRPDAPAYATEFPYPVDAATLERGRERF